LGGQTPLTRKKEILITGGAGYVGSVLTRTLNKEYHVTVVDSLLYGQPPPNEADFFRVDVRDTAKIHEIMRGKDILVHLAGIVGEEACNVNSQMALQVNFLASRELVKCAAQHGVRIIYPSSCSVYGFQDKVIDENADLRPLSIYAMSKVAEENSVVLSSSDYVIFRFGTIYGYSPRMRFDLVINRFIAQAIFDKTITIFGGQQYRPFIHIQDVADAVKLCVESKLVGLFNLGGENFTINDVANSISSTLSCNVVRYSELQDRRNYKVSSKKFFKATGFQLQKSILDAIAEIKRTIELGTIKSYKETCYSNAESLRGMKT
jgi:nucleoside-diphosphate-sugar epimerase